jgi:hypothetical protein
MSSKQAMSAMDIDTGSALPFCLISVVLAGVNATSVKSIFGYSASRILGIRGQHPNNFYSPYDRLVGIFGAGQYSELFPSQR